MKRVILAVLMLALVPAMAQAQLYGVSLNGASNGNPGPSSLYSIDPTTGAGTLIGDMGYAVNALAVDPTTGILYASTTAWNAGGEGFNGLLQIDPSTGAATEIGPFGDQFRAIVTLTFNSSGQLYGWHDPSEDDLVSIDLSTGAATEIGEAGLSTYEQIMAFDLTGTLRLVNGDDNHYTIDPATGSSTLVEALSFHPGYGGSAFDASGLWWAPGTPGRTQDAIIRVTDIAAGTFVDIDTDVEYLNAVTFGDVDVVAGTALFSVTKTFSNGADGDVEVTLTCNGGIPLVQSFTISADGPGVTFTVTNLPDTGADCAVTESGGNDGYTADLSACSWTGVIGGARSCPIENVPEPTTVMVNTTVEGEDDAAIDTSFTTTIVCENVSADTGAVFGTVTVDDTSGMFEADWYADPTNGTDCTVTMVPNDMAVEGDSCSFSFDIGDEEAGCDVAGTVFFEGIPTLSQYGLALMALLMLGVGFVGMRRFV